MIIRSLHWYAIQQDTFSGTNESSRRQLVHAETPHRGWQFRRRMFASNNPSQLYVNEPFYLSDTQDCS